MAEGEEKKINPSQKDSRRGVLLIATLAGLISGLCCFTPVVLVLVGLATISTAASLGDVLYGNYRWWFRGAGLVFLAIALIIYFRRRGICTLDEARRQRNRIINVSLVVLIFSIGIYILWTYVAVQYWGIAVGLPWAQYDESWAIPASAIVLGIAIVAFLALFIRRGKSRGGQNAEHAP